jgi:hypothetical protein
MYDGQLDAAVQVVDFLTWKFGIQRQVPKAYHKRPAARLLHAGDDFSGVYGHRDADDNRGLGDPGDAVFQKLMAAGYEGWELDAYEDFPIWKDRQTQVGADSDGIPGLGTRDAIIAFGKPSGMWVDRPGDPT